MFKFILPLTTVLLLFSCSKIETGLNFAPRIATSKIDDAFDFKSEKLSTIRKQIDLDIQNSKKDLAQKLISHVETLEKYSKQSEISKTEMITFFNDWAETQTALLESFRKSADVTLKNLKPEEIENFKAYSEKKYAEEIALAKDKKAFLKKKRQTFEKNYDLFFDGLNNDQEKMLNVFLDDHMDYFIQRILSRQKFSEEFYMKIKSQDLVLDTILSHYSGKKLSAITDLPLKGYLDQFFDFQVALWKTATEKQKNYFRKVLGDYKDQLKKIASN